MKSSFISRRRMCAAAAAGVVIPAYFAWAWLSFVPDALRSERLMGNEHEIQNPKTIEEKSQARPSRPSRREGFRREPLNVLSNDELTDFVIDKGNSFGFPGTRKELDRAIADGKAERTSSYFRQQYERDKPFYGEIPLSLCHWDGHSGWGVREVSRFQIRKDYESVDVSLETPKRPEIFVVAGANIYGAQRSAYERSAPVAYRWESYWAVIYAGSGSSSTPYVMDRVHVGEAEAEIRLYRPPVFAANSDVQPYWYFVPLGRLPEGPYSVKVRLANNGEIQSSVTASLRRATEKEQSARDEYWENEQTGGNRHYKKLKHLEDLHAAGLQLRLERLAEFVDDLSGPEVGREVLAGDVATLGKAVDWDRNTYGSPHRHRRELAPATPGKAIKIGDLDLRWDSVKTPWKPSGIPLSKVWMCDGTDAKWYLSETYRAAPELEGALTAAEPSPIQRKIREIWAAVDERHQPPGNDGMRSFSAAGSLESVIDQAHRVFVHGAPRPELFAPEDEMWVVYIASSSFLIRQIDTRYYEDKYRRTKHGGFMIHTSAYVAGADGVDEAKFAPVTLALIPLGKPGDVDSVGVGFSCRSVCCRNVGTADEEPLDVRLPDLWSSGIAGNQDYGAAFQVQRRASRK